jgi:hypothetical protein
MTAQTPDKLQNDHPRVDFGDLRLYGLIRSDPSSAHCWSGVLGEPFDYPRTPAPRDGGYSTACYRGYVASHVLNADGTLTLSHFEYTVFEPAVIDGANSVSIRMEEDVVNQSVTGDFWMVLRPNFYTDPTTFVPFRKGRIVEDKSQWIVST